MIHSPKNYSNEVAEEHNFRIAVVIPCYKVRGFILKVLQGIPQWVDDIYVIDDACPDRTGELVKEQTDDARIKVLHHDINKGVGGAVISGYLKAIDDKVDIVVKLDGDGQMNPSHMRELVEPLVSGKADYTKGNRFYDLETLKSMPKSRIFGNAVLSFMNKLSTGYWDIFDPTNGYTAITASMLRRISWQKVSSRFFFESDTLFRLNINRAVVLDVPMPAYYGDEISNLRISRVVGEFTYKHTRNMIKRIFYNYYLRDFSVASLNLLFGLLFLASGILLGSLFWYTSATTGVPQTAGTVMLSALPIILGIQLLLAFLSYDIASIPKHKS